jgi:Zn-dependent protease/CBS domain-containing protein
LKWSLKIGAVSGIDIKIHFTFVFIVLWAAAQGASDAGGMRGAAYATVSVLLLFLCVTLHELGHSLMARRLGVRVKDITLLPIGGVARLETMPEKPSHELLIAAAGPSVNFVIALGLGLVLLLAMGARLFFNPGHLVRLLLGPGSLLSLVVYLLSANLVLGVFNLIPAFPMDGGRMVRAFLAVWTSYPRATRIAARIGQVMAVGLALLAFYDFPSFNFSLILVALFVFTGASYEDQMVQSRAALRELLVRHALPLRPVYAVAPEDTLSSVMEMGHSAGQYDFPVVRERMLEGILARNDLLTALRQVGGATRVEQTMRRDFPRVSHDDPLLHAQQLIAQSGLTALPVFDQARFLGLITLEDINRAYADRAWRRR